MILLSSYLVSYNNCNQYMTILTNYSIQYSFPLNHIITINNINKTKNLSIKIINNTNFEIFKNDVY